MTDILSPDPWAHATPPEHLAWAAAPFRAITCAERDSLFTALGGASALTIDPSSRREDHGPSVTRWVKDGRPVLLDTITAGTCWHHAIEETPDGRR